MRDACFFLLFIYFKDQNLSWPSFPSFFPFPHLSFSHSLHLLFPPPFFTAGLAHPHTVSAPPSSLFPLILTSSAIPSLLVLFSLQPFFPHFYFFPLHPNIVPPYTLPASRLPPRYSHPSCSFSLILTPFIFPSSSFLNHHSPHNISPLSLIFSLCTSFLPLTLLSHPSSSLPIPALSSSSSSQSFPLLSLTTFPPPLCLSTPHSLVTHSPLLTPSSFLHFPFPFPPLHNCFLISGLALIKERKSLA